MHAPSAMTDVKRRIDAFVTQCRAVAARNDCDAARKIAAQIAEQYPESMRPTADGGFYAIAEVIGAIRMSWL